MLAVDVAAWGWPQWTVLAAWALSLTIHAAMNGKPIHDYKWNFALKLMGVALAAFVLAFGGFFS